jgi:5'-nucleotidase
MTRVLVTNDDGILALGIQTLVEALQHLAIVTVVAPDREKSATGHCITVHSPLRVEQLEISGAAGGAWAVDGTPSDCVKLAIQSLMTEPPDLVVSGINRGGNLGTDILYSGTVSAAIEGIINGIPAIAVSLNTFVQPDYSYAAKFTGKLVDYLFTNKLTVDTLLNVNIPAIPESEVKGVAITKLGNRKYDNLFERRTDPSGKFYFWMGGKIVDVPNDADSDVAALQRGEVSVTPIHFDLTNYRIIEEVKKWGLQP